MIETSIFKRTGLIPVFTREPEWGGVRSTESGYQAFFVLDETPFWKKFHRFAYLALEALNTDLYVNYLDSHAQKTTPPSLAHQERIHAMDAHGYSHRLFSRDLSEFHQELTYYLRVYAPQVEEIQKKGNLDGYTNSQVKQREHLKDGYDWGQDFLGSIDFVNLFTNTVNFNLSRIEGLDAYLTEPNNTTLPKVLFSNIKTYPFICVQRTHVFALRTLKRQKSTYTGSGSILPQAPELSAYLLSLNGPISPQINSAIAGVLGQPDQNLNPLHDSGDRHSFVGSNAPHWTRQWESLQEALELQSLVSTAPDNDDPKHQPPVRKMRGL